MAAHVSARQGRQQVKRDVSMGSGLCRPRQGRQWVKRDMIMGSGLCRPRQGRQRVKRDMRMGLPKGSNLRPRQRVNPGRCSMQSSKIMTGCRSLQARHKIG